MQNTWDNLLGFCHNPLFDIENMEHTDAFDLYSTLYLILWLIVLFWKVILFDIENMEHTNSFDLYSTLYLILWLIVLFWKVILFDIENMEHTNSFDLYITLYSMGLYLNIDDGVASYITL